MTTLHALGPLSQIPAGEGRTFQVGQHAVAVFRTRAGGLFATQASCPHRNGPLADGLVGLTSVMCPLHDWTFDLGSGEAKQGECGVKVYPITQREDGTMVITLD